MAIHAQVTTINNDLWTVPITLKVCMDWERWSGKTLSAMADPTAADFAYLCWRACRYAGVISRLTTFDAFSGIVCGWEITNIQPNGIDQLEDWLKDQ
jgi:hypothetical protein